MRWYLVLREHYSNDLADEPSFSVRFGAAGQRRPEQIDIECNNSGALDP